MPKFYIDTTGKVHAEMPDEFIFVVEEDRIDLAAMPRNWINQSKHLFATIRVNGEDVMDIIRIDAIEALGLTSLDGFAKQDVFPAFATEENWRAAVHFFAIDAKKHYVGLPIEVALTSLPLYVGAAEIKKREIQHKQVQRYLKRKGIKVEFSVLFSGLLNDSVKPTASELEWFNEMGEKHNYERIS